MLFFVFIARLLRISNAFCSKDTCFPPTLLRSKELGKKKLSCQIHSAPNPTTGRTAPIKRQKNRRKSRRNSPTAQSGATRNKLSYLVETASPAKMAASAYREWFVLSDRQTTKD